MRVGRFVLCVMHVCACFVCNVLVFMCNILLYIYMDIDVLISDRYNSKWFNDFCAECGYVYMCVCMYSYYMRVGG